MSPDRPDGRRRDTRERIVRVATGVFRRHGLHGAGIKEVCERAGVSKGVFSHHFPGGKEELVSSVVARNGADVELAFHRLAAADHRSAGDAVRGAFELYGALLRSQGHDFGCPVAASVIDASATSSPIRLAAHRAFAAWRAAIGQSRDGAPGTSGAPSAVVADLDALIVAALEGAILLARADEDPAVVERVGAALAQLLDAAGPGRAA